jgi:hypothetical protein
VCDAAYGLSIARGSFTFSRGAWTHVSQTVVLNSPGEQDGVFILEVNGDVAIDLSDVFYGDRPREPDYFPTPSCNPNLQLDDGCGWLGSLLGGPIKSRPGFRDDGTPSRGLSTAQAPLDSSTGIATSVWCDTLDANAPTDGPSQQGALEDGDDICNINDDCPPPAACTQKTGHPVGFQGIFFRHVLSKPRDVITLTPILGPRFWHLVRFFGDTTRTSLRRKTSLFGLRILRFISTIPDDKVHVQI